MNINRMAGAHNPKVSGSNPLPATNDNKGFRLRAVRALSSDSLKCFNRTVPLLRKMKIMCVFS